MLFTRLDIRITNAEQEKNENQYPDNVMRLFCRQLWPSIGITINICDIASVLNMADIWDLSNIT
jgi:hypothetical protein